MCTLEERSECITFLTWKLHLSSYSCFCLDQINYFYPETSLGFQKMSFPSSFRLFALVSITNCSAALPSSPGIPPFFSSYELTYQAKQNIKVDNLSITHGGLFCLFGIRRHLPNLQNNLRVIWWFFEKQLTHQNSTYVMLSLNLC